MAKLNKLNYTEELTLVVLKDNLASRTFRVPLRWISSIGLLAGTLVGVSILALGLAYQFHRNSLKSDPEKVNALQTQLAEITAEYEKLQNDIRVSQQTEETPPVADGAIPPPATTPVEAKLNLLLPANTKPAPAEVAEAIKIDQLATHWKGGFLHVDFNLLYVKNDNGNQQGRIVILARGPSVVLSHPTEAMDYRVTATSLINPERGEHFSVSRFRQSKAQFGPVNMNQKIDNITILIFDKQGQILANQMLSTTSQQQEKTSHEPNH